MSLILSAEIGKGQPISAVFLKSFMRFLFRMVAGLLLRIRLRH